MFLSVVDFDYRPR